MAESVPQDKSNGYDLAARRFMSARNPRIGVATVREWSKALPRGASILDLGCGHGEPIARILIADGFDVSGIDASAQLIAAFRERFPGARTECSSVEESDFFGRTFDGVLAVGLLFLLLPEVQASVIGKVSKVLNPGGKFLFTSPREAVAWPDALTGRKSISLGAAVYRQILSAAGLILEGMHADDGGNDHYFVSKP